MKSWRVLCGLLLLVSLAALCFASGAGQILLQGKIVDENGIPIRARVVVWEDQNKPLGVAFSKEDGNYSIKVPAAEKMIVEASHGPEYEINRLEVDGEQPSRVNFTLRHLYDMEKLGWYCGDSHTHSTFSDGVQSPAELADVAVAEDLDWAVLTDHNTVSGAAEWLRTARPGFIPIIGEEITNKWGHLVGLNLEDVVLFAEGASDAEIREGIERVKANGGLVFPAHPCVSGFSYKRWEANNFNGLEIWNGGVPPNLLFAGNLEAKQRWFGFLNKGVRMPALGGSDCHEVHSAPLNKYFTAPEEFMKEHKPEEKLFIMLNREAFRRWAVKGCYLGIPRTYGHLSEFSLAGILEALRRGNLFLTNGPLVLVDLNGTIPGEAVKLEKGLLRIKAMSNRSLKELKVVVNGKEVKRFEVEGSEVEKEMELSFGDCSWVVVECMGEYPEYAITNAIYVNF